MPLPNLASIKKRRIILGKTQNQLAKLCGLSQSVIAKIEHGAVDPAYTTASRIFETLERLESKETSDDSLLNLTAKDVMTNKIISVKLTDNVAKAQQHFTDTSSNISQLPVLDEDGKSVGSLTEAQVLTLQGSDKTLVRDVMLDPFTIVSPNTSLSTVRNILLDEPAVLVSDARSGTIGGIITKYDLINALRSSKS